MSGLQPFTGYTEIMKGEKTDDYVQLLLNGFSHIQRQHINIGCAICDGHTAQKKAFSLTYKRSIRHLTDYPWMAQIYYIPCLCHRINNAYKNAVLQSESLSRYTELLHQIAFECKSHKDELGKVCPTFVSTRWVYDYDIALFIMKNKEEIQKYVDVPDDIDDFVDVAKVFKLLVLTCESSTQPFFTGFRLIEKALVSLNKLEEPELKDSLFAQTLGSKEGGIWILSYLFTKEGHDDFHARLHSGDLSPPDEPLEYSTPRYSTPKDPLEQEVQWILEQYLENEEMKLIQTEEEEEEEWEEGEDENEEEDYENVRRSKTYLTQAKDALKLCLQLDGYEKHSVKLTLQKFNTFIDDINPFQEYLVDSPIGYSWTQIRANVPDFSSIANVALKLHCAALSEASCERTISAQRLINNARRRSSNTLTLEARLTIMRSDSKANIYL